MKHSKLFFFLLIPLISSCNKENNNYVYRYSDFDTLITITFYESIDKNILNKIEDELYFYHVLSDNFVEYKGYNNVYTLNHNKDIELEINKELYDLLKCSKSAVEITKGYYNPYMGSLSDKWLTSLNKNEILSNSIINEELDKINNSELILREIDNKYYAKMVGEASLDLGGIAKGYALDKIKDILSENNIKNYLIDAGRSSILLGEKKTSNKLFNVGLNNIKNTYLELNNQFLGISAIYEQNKIIDKITYTHIINPFTGSARTKYDLVFVSGEYGYLTDYLSTALINMEITDIKEIENSCNVKCFVYKGNEFLYINDNLEVKYY